LQVYWLDVPRLARVVAPLLLACACSAGNGESDGGDAGRQTDGGIADSGVGSCPVYDGGNSDPRCSAANCQLILNCGGGGLPGTARNSSECLAIAGVEPAGLADELVEQCVEACRIWNNGEILACFASQCSLPDGGDPGDLCNDAGFNIPYGMCVEPCDIPLQTCEAGCSTTDAGACLDCGFQCAQQYVCCATTNCSGYL
jgi:hypothetical protein